MLTVDSVPKRKISRDGIEIAYWVHGESGPPLLLITGLGTPAMQWGPLPGILAQQGYRAIVVDNRDCGSSSPCDGIEYDIHDMADDAVAVLDDLGIEKAYLAGISMGGMISQEILIRHPNRIIKAILMATTPGGEHHVSADPAFLNEVFFAVPNAEDPVGGTEVVLGKLMGPGFAEANAESIRNAAEIRVEHGSDPAQFARQWNAIMRFSAWDRLSEVTTPVLVIHGDADPLVPFPNGTNIASRVPGAELIAIPGVGHFVPLEAPAEVIGAIARFFPVESSVEKQTVS